MAVVGESSAFQRRTRPPARMPICAVSHLGSNGGGRGGVDEQSQQDGRGTI